MSTEETKDYFDTLDDAYRTVDAMGGTGCPKGKEDALECIEAAIFHMGGRQPWDRKREGYPSERPPAWDDGGPYFRIYMLRVGHTLTTQDVADIQQVLQQHNDLIGEQADLLHHATEQAMLNIGGQELLDAHRSKQSARIDAIVAKALADVRTQKAKAQ